MKIIKQKELINSIENNIKKSIYNEYIYFLVKKYFKEDKVYILGGAVRDSIINYYYKKNLKPNNFDIIIDDSYRKIDLFKKLKNEKNVSSNSHGSVRWKPKKDIEIDITTTSNSNPIKNGKKVKPSLNLFLKTCDFNTGSIAYDIKKKIIYDFRAINGIKNKRIEIIGGNDPIYKIILRLVLQSKRLDFLLGKKEIRLIKNKYSKGLDKDIKKYLISKNRLKDFSKFKKEIKKYL